MFKRIAIISVSLIIFACNKESDRSQKEPDVEQINKNWGLVWHDFNVSLLTVTFSGKDTGYVLTYIDSLKSQSIFTTNDAGKTWNSKVINIDPHIKFYYDILPIDKVLYGYYFSQGYYMGQNITNLVQSYDGGSSWTNITYKSRNFIFDNFFYVKDNLNIYASTFELDSTTGEQYAVLYATSDGGKTWQDISLNENDILIYQVNFLSEYKGVMLVRHFNEKIDIYKTSDGGQNWFKVDGYSPAVLKVQFIDEKNWFCTYEDTLFRTINGGLSWDKVHTFNKLDGFNIIDEIHIFDSRYNLRNATSLFTKRIQFANAEKGFLYKDRNILITTDGGSSWDTDFTLTGKPYYEKIVGMAVVKTGEVYIITDCGTIYKRTK